MRERVIAGIEREKLIAIIRGVEADQLIPVAEALYSGGIRLMEITFNQKDPSSYAATANAIAMLDKEMENRMLVGAGTVTTCELVELVAEAGGKFIISPDVNVPVIRRTRELGMVSIPGAMTPTEIMTAHNAGADFVKLFPAGELGVSYIKAVRAPISHVKLLGVGGIDEHDIPNYMKVGICGFGIGGNLVKNDWVARGEFHKITEVAQNLVSAVHKTADFNG